MFIEFSCVGFKHLKVNESQICQNSYNIFLSSEALNLCNVFVIEHNFIKLSQIFLHVWENLFVAVGDPEPSNKVASYTTGQEVFVVIPFSSSGSPYIVWRDNSSESFLFVLQHRETLSSGLLNNLKKLEACVISMRKRINVLMFVEKNLFGAARKAVPGIQELLCF